MKHLRLHLLAFAIVIISELIGKHTFDVGIGTIVLLPMLFALILGVLITTKFLPLAKEKEMKQAGRLITVTLMLLMAKYGTLIGPTIDVVLKSSPALILQELGNVGTVLLGVPLGMALGLGREVVGGAHSISREANVALVSERYGLDSPEGQGVLGVYIVGTVFGTIFMGLFASILASATPLHPYALAMASGVGSASMMTASVGALTELYPAMAKEIGAFGAASNMLSGLDGLYMSVFLSLPLAEWMYRRLAGKRYERPAYVTRKEEDDEI